MRRVLALLLLAAPALAAAPDLVKLETSMWDMWKAKDAKSFAALLADDFYDVYFSGAPTSRRRRRGDYAPPRPKTPSLRAARSGTAIFSSTTRP